MTTASIAPRPTDHAASKTPLEFHLGIVGGCMSHQAGIPFNSLYHRQLGQLLEAETGIRLRSHVARAFSQEYTARLDWLAERFTIDAVLLHLRVVLTGRARLILKDRTAGRRRWRVHPALFRRGHAGPDVEALRANEMVDLQTDVPDEERARRYERRRGKRLAALSLRDLSSAFGAVVGLDRWAVDDEMLRLAEFVAECDRRGLPLFVLGPTPLVGQRWGARVLRLLNRRIPEFAGSRGLPYALIGGPHDVDGHPVVKRDGVHLTIDGHSFVARRLVAAGFNDWVSRTGRDLATRTLAELNTTGSADR